MFFSVLCLLCLCARLFIYLRTLKKHHQDYILYFTNPDNVSEIIVIAYHSLA